MQVLCSAALQSQSAIHANSLGSHVRQQHDVYQNLWGRGGAPLAEDRQDGSSTRGGAFEPPYIVCQAHRLTLTDPTHAGIPEAEREIAKIAKIAGGADSNVQRNYPDFL